MAIERVARNSLRWSARTGAATPRDNSQMRTAVRPLKRKMEAMSKPSDIGAVRVAIEEIRAVCRKHGIALIGDCSDEGIYGEIRICKADEMDDNDKRRCQCSLDENKYDIAINAIN